MFELTTAVNGGSESAPTFRLYSSNTEITAAFEIDLNDRSPNGTTDQIGFPLPSQAGEFFYMDIGLRESETIAISQAQAIESPTEAPGGACYWRDGESIGLLLPQQERELLIYESVDAAAATVAGNAVQSSFEGTIAWNDLDRSGAEVVISDSQDVSGRGLRGVPLWHLQVDGSIIAATVDKPYGAPAIATETHFLIPPQINGVYQFNLQRISGGKILRVMCEGQEFDLAAGEVSAAGEYVLGRDVLTINGTLRHQIEVISINTWPWPRDLYYFRFDLPAGVVVEQCRFLGQVFGLVENELHPQAGEFLVVRDSTLYLFVERLPSNNLDFSPELGRTAGQILTEVNW